MRAVPTGVLILVLVVPGLLLFSPRREGRSLWQGVSLRPAVWAGALLLAVSLALTLPGAWQWLAWPHSVATVTTLVQGTAGVRDVAPTLRFSTPYGTVLATTPHYENPSRYRVGEPVQMAWNPLAPGHVVARKDLAIPLEAVGVPGLVVLAATATLARWRRRRDRG